MPIDLITSFEKMCSRNGLDEIGKNDFLLFISRISDEKQVELLKFLKDNQHWISRISENIQAKKKAFGAKDKVAWNEILEKESLDLLKLEIGMTD